MINSATEAGNMEGNGLQYLYLPIEICILTALDGHIYSSSLVLPLSSFRDVVS